MPRSNSDNVTPIASTSRGILCVPEAEEKFSAVVDTSSDEHNSFVPKKNFSIPNLQSRLRT